MRGQFYLYLIEDIYSRKVVGYEVYETESGKHPAELLQRSLLKEDCLHKPLVLHSDNGAPMKAQTMRGIEASEKNKPHSLGARDVRNCKPLAL